MSPPGSRPAEALRRVEQEIRQAKAEALGRLGERLDRALGRLGDLDHHLDRMGRVSGESLDARNRLRDEAARLVQYLVIQREAIGVRCHRAVHERYPLPPRRSR